VVLVLLHRRIEWEEEIKKKKPLKGSSRRLLAEVYIRELAWVRGRMVEKISKKGARHDFREVRRESGTITPSVRVEGARTNCHRLGKGQRGKVRMSWKNLGQETIELKHQQNNQNRGKTRL